MSLLLAALKKSEEIGAEERGLAELQLEEIPTPPSCQPGTKIAPLPNLGNSQNTSQSPSSLNKISSTRAQEKNLFSAKNIAPIKRLKLGIIPIALIGGGIFAVAGSLYVYHQITSPAHTSPPTQNIAAPIATSPPVVTATALLPLIPTAEIAPADIVTEEPPSPLPATKIVKAKAPTLNIHHQPESDSIDPILTSAYQAYQNGNYVTAEQHYRNALAQDKNNRDALLGLAAIAQQQGQDETALQYYRRVLLLDPRDPAAQAAMAAFDHSDPTSKESRLNQLIAQQPDSAALHFALGNQYADQSRWAEAQQAYFNALAAEPNNALFAFNLAISLDHLGQRNTAAQYYRQALQLDISGHSGFTHEQAQQRLDQLTSH
jgi:Tfp pilus assembly protein PilF